jgi:uncharacterized repeat protein (TIGR03809 family)
MTHRADVVRGRSVVARWFVLAERRLEHLTELFETGRWRRYHSERAFLENLSEAKSAVESWRDLSTREASRDNTAVDVSWLGRTEAALSIAERLRDQIQRLQLRPAETVAEPQPPEASILAETNNAGSDETSSAPAMEDALGLTPDGSAVMERYPLLRNAL